MCKIGGSARLKIHTAGQPCKRGHRIPASLRGLHRERSRQRAGPVQRLRQAQTVQHHIMRESVRVLAAEGDLLRRSTALTV